MVPQHGRQDPEQWAGFHLCAPRSPGILRGCGSFGVWIRDHPTAQIHPAGAVAVAKPSPWCRIQGGSPVPEPPGMHSACSAPNKSLSPIPASACLQGHSGCGRGLAPGRFGGAQGVPLPAATVVGGAARHKDGCSSPAHRALPDKKMASEERSTLTSSIYDAAGPRGSWRGRAGALRHRDRPPRLPRLRARLDGGGKAARSGRRRWWPSRGASPSRDGCGRIPGRRGSPT